MLNLDRMNSFFGRQSEKGGSQQRENNKEFKGSSFKRQAGGANSIYEKGPDRKYSISSFLSRIVRQDDERDQNDSSALSDYLTDEKVKGPADGMGNKVLPTTIHDSPYGAPYGG